MLGWILGGIVGILGLGLALLWLWFPDEKIRQMVVRELEKTLQISIEVKRLEIHWLRGIRLEEVSLGPARGFSLPPLRVKSFWLEYSLADLWHKRLVVRQIRLEQPEVQLELTPQGSNLPQLPPGKPPEPGPPPPPSAAKPTAPLEFILDLQSVQIRDGRIVLKLEKAQVEIGGFDLKLSGRLGSPANTRLEVEGGFASARSRMALEVRYGDGIWPIRAQPHFSFRLALSAWSRQLLAGQLELLEFRLNERGPGHRVSLSWDVQADLGGQSVTLRRIQLAWDGEPWIDLQGQLEQIFGAWKVAGTIHRLSLPASLVQDLAARVLPALGYQGEVSLRDLRIQMARDDRWPKASGELALKGVSLSLGQTALAAGQGALRLSLDGAQVLSLNLSGQVAAARLHAFDLDLAHPAIELNATAELAPLDQGWALIRPRLKLGGSARALQSPFAKLDGIRIRTVVASEKESIPLSAIGFRLADLAVQGEAQVAGVTLAALSARQSQLSWDLAATRVVRGAGRAGLSAGLRGRCALRVEKLAAGAIQVDKVELTAQAEGQGLRAVGKFQRPLSVSLSLRTAAIRAAPLDLSGLRLEASSQLAALPLGELPIEVKTVVQGPRLQKILGGTDLVLPGDLQVALRASWAQVQQKLRVESLSVEEPGFFTLRAEGDFALPTRQGGLKLSTGPIVLEKVLALLPEAMRAGWPTVIGEIELGGKTQLALPEGPLDWRQLELPLDVTLRWNRIGVTLAAPALSLQDLSGLLEVQSRGMLGKQLRLQTSWSLGQARIEALGLQLSSLTGNLEAERAGLTLDARAKVALGELSAPRWLPKPLAGVSLDISGRGVEQKEWHLDRFLLQLGSLGLGVNASGRLVFPPGSREWDQMRVSSRVGLDLATPSIWTLPGQVALSGGARLSVSVDTLADGMIQTLGRMEFDNLNVIGPGFGLAGMKGSIPVTQRIAINALGAQGARDILYGQPRERVGWAVYEDALRPMMGKNRAFAIQNVRFRDLEMSNVAGSLVLAEGHLNLGNLQFVFLRGDILANADLVLSPASHRRLSLDAEMSGVDISKLGALSFAESSEVSGNLHLVLDMREKAFSATVNLTQIGRSTLQALLIALDPGKTNPGVQSLRNYLDGYDVSPRRVSLQILHGLLGMDAVLDMGLAARTAARLIAGFDGDTFRLKHLPVAGLLAKYLGF